MTLFFQFQNRVFDRGSKPGAARHSLALESKLPVAGGKRRRTRHKQGSFLGLGFVTIPLGDRALGNTVCGKNYGHSGRHFGAGSLPSSTNFLREGSDQERMVVPRFDEIHGKRCAPFKIQRSAIQSYAGARVLRSQTDDHGTGDAVGLHPTHRLRDKRLPVAHAHVDGQFQFFRQEIALLQRQLCKRGPANQPVAMPHFFDHFQRNRTATCDLTQEFRYVVHRIGASVSQEQNRIFLRTGQFNTPDLQCGVAPAPAKSWRNARLPLHCAAAPSSAEYS